jgi:hypothetical protein
MKARNKQRSLGANGQGIPRAVYVARGIDIEVLAADLAVARLLSNATTSPVGPDVIPVLDHPSCREPVKAEVGGRIPLPSSTRRGAWGQNFMKEISKGFNASIRVRDLQRNGETKRQLDQQDESPMDISREEALTSSLREDSTDVSYNEGDYMELQRAKQEANYNITRAEGVERSVVAQRLNDHAVGAILHGDSLIAASDSDDIDDERSQRPYNPFIDEEAGDQCPGELTPTAQSTEQTVSGSTDSTNSGRENKVNRTKMVSVAAKKTRSSSKPCGFPLKDWTNTLSEAETRRAMGLINQAHPVSYENMSVWQEGIERLDPDLDNNKKTVDKYLNDEVIDMFFGLLKRQFATDMGRGTASKTCFFNTQFMTKILQEGHATEDGQYSYSQVKNWTKRFPGKLIPLCLLTTYRVTSF